MVESSGRSVDQRQAFAANLVASIGEGVWLCATPKGEPYVEGIDPIAEALWRAYPPCEGWKQVWGMEIWMRRHGATHLSGEALALALHAYVVSNPPRLRMNIPIPAPLPGAQQGGVAPGFAEVAWSIKKACVRLRECAYLEQLILSHLPGLNDFRIDAMQRSPEDVITWMTGKINNEDFVYQQSSGYLQSAVLEIGPRHVGPRRLEVRAAAGWYGDQIVARNMIALVQTLARETSSNTGIGENGRQTISLGEITDMSTAWSHGGEQ